MHRRRLWWLSGLVPAWPGGLLALRLAAAGRLGQAMTAVALAAAVAAVLLASFGWGLRGERPAPPWRPRPWVGAVLAALLLALVAAGAVAGRAAVVWWWLGAVGAGWALVRWCARGLPKGFAPRLTGWARVLALAAIPLWTVTLADRPAALLAAKPAILTVGACVGILSLAGGVGVGEWLRPVFAARPHRTGRRRIGIRASGCGGGRA